MQKLLLFIVVVVFLASCSGRKIPDVSHIKVEIQLQRFEQDFFAIDTSHVSASLQQLHEKYPGFLQDYIFNILGLPPQPDSSLAVEEGVRTFLSSYKSLKDHADKVFADMSDMEKKTREGL